MSGQLDIKLPQITVPAFAFAQTRQAVYQLTQYKATVDDSLLPYTHCFDSPGNRRGNKPSSRRRNPVINIGWRLGARQSRSKPCAVHFWPDKINYPKVTLVINRSHQCLKPLLINLWQFLTIIYENVARWRREWKKFRKQRVTHFTFNLFARPSATEYFPSLHGS